MSITHLFAGVPTRDFAVAIAWYERLLGRPPDRFPHEAEAVWQLVDRALVYVVADRERAGRSLITLIVDDLTAWTAEVEARGLAVGEEQRVGGNARRAVLSDPDGNTVSVAQVPG